MSPSERRASRSAVADHLADCIDCRARYAELAQFMDGLRDAGRRRDRRRSSRPSGCARSSSRSRGASSISASRRASSASRPRDAPAPGQVTLSASAVAVGGGCCRRRVVRRRRRSGSSSTAGPADADGHDGRAPARAGGADRRDAQPARPPITATIDASCRSSSWRSSGRSPELLPFDALTPHALRCSLSRSASSFRTCAPRSSCRLPDLSKGLDLKEAVAGMLAESYHSQLIEQIKATDFTYRRAA